MESRDAPGYDWANAKTRLANHLVIYQGYQSTMTSLTQMFTCFQAVNSPKSTPFSLAALELVNESMRDLVEKIRSIGFNLESLSTLTDTLAKFYDFLDGSNKIKDGTVPFPENQAQLACGVSVEFRNVSFSYPGGSELVLKNVSFKIKQGHLCVRAFTFFSVSPWTKFCRSTFLGYRWRKRLRKKYNSPLDYPCIRRRRGGDLAQRVGHSHFETGRCQEGRCCSLPGLLHLPVKRASGTSSNEFPI
jgi:hypothetical protein